MKITIKLISILLSLVFCLSALAGCKRDEKDDTPEEITFNYEIKPITDEPHSIDAQNDAVTMALLTSLTETYPEFEGYYYCESHSIACSTYADGVDSFDAIAYRDETLFYDPVTGNYGSFSIPDVYCLMTFEKATNGYNSVSYEEFSSIDEALEAANGVFGDKNDTDTELSPYRYVKDGAIYLLDYERYVTYCDNLVLEILNASKVTDSYKPIITKNKETYAKLFDSDFLSSYIIDQFMNGEKNSPKAYVLYRALEDVLEKGDESINYELEDEKKAQVFFEKLLAYAKDMRAKDGTVATAFRYPTWCSLIHEYDASLTDEEALAEKYMYPNPDKIIIHSDDGEKELTKNDEGYADVIRANQRNYIKTDDAFTVAKNVNAEKAIRQHYQELERDSTKYIEYVYADENTPNYLFSYDAALMLVPTSSGKYDVYNTSVTSSELVEVIDGLLK